VNSFCLRVEESELHGEWISLNLTDDIRGDASSTALFTLNPAFLSYPSLKTFPKVSN
jgi:hypothetical protein